MNDLDIISYTPSFRERILDFAASAWMPVFARPENELSSFGCETLYPQSWLARQTGDIACLLDTEPDNFWLAFHADALVGFIGVRMHPKNWMGEVVVIAVSTDWQQHRVDQSLMAFGEQRVRAAGLKMVMVETASDSGFTPAPGPQRSPRLPALAEQLLFQAAMIGAGSSR